MKRRTQLLMTLLLSVLLLAGTQVMAKKQMSLTDMYKVMKTMKWVDLTHAFDKNIPHWKGFTGTYDTKCLYHYDPGVGSDGYGFLVHKYTHVGQWGTHVDPPAHFIKGKRTQDEICVKEMFLPLVVFDVHEQVAANPDYVLTLADVKAWEKEHGPVPEVSFCAMRTDWSKRWPSNEKMANKDENGVDHYPGWTMEALKYLYEVRKITASGHEPTDTDPGLSTTKDNYECEAYILMQDKYQIELMTNLDQCPEVGGLIVVTWPKAKKGSGFPARAFAIVPNN